MSTESWLTVRKDGTIMRTTENDGWTFLNRGPERETFVISVDELRSCYPELYRLYAAGPAAAGPYSRVQWEK